MQKCPICKGEIILFFERGLDVDTFKVGVSEKDDSEVNSLIKALFSYINWLNNGKKPYGPGKDEQMYHDQYHNDIDHVQGVHYTFNIRVYDSPSLDIWWKGEFNLNGATIEITVSGYKRVSSS
jgi:hypothetical protein